MAIDRRRFLAKSSAWVSAAALSTRRLAQAHATPAATCRFGLVTYLWGKSLSLPELIDACAQSEVLGVELRTTHAHGVEPSLSAIQRKEVRARFSDSPVMLVGLGSNERFDDPDPEKVRAAVARSKDFLKLSHDVGSSGVKVKGDRFHDPIPHQQTLDQVAEALRELGDFAEGLDQQVRLEVHGGFRDIPLHHEIIHRTDHPRVRTCWNSNPQDLDGAGLRANFELVRGHFGETAHVRQLDSPGYPWDDLIEMFVDSNYSGWILLEAHGELPASQVASQLTKQRERFDAFVALAQRTESSEKP